MDKLIHIAIEFREAIESTKPEQRPITLKKFPNGSCGDATLLLGAYLIELGEEPFDYMLGNRGDEPNDENWSSHAWLQRGKLIIDITADQFPENTRKVIVTCDSEWHNSLDGNAEHVADYKIYENNTMNPLGPFYRVITDILKYT